MTQDTIAKIEQRLQSSGLTGDVRAELLALLAQLKSEVSQLSPKYPEQAESIASFTEISTFEATRTNPNPASLAHSLGGLESSVSEFEKSHPSLVAVVNRLTSLLSNMGI